MSAYRQSDGSQEFELDVLGRETKTRRRSFKRAGQPDTSWYYFGIVGQIGFSIAIPIAGGAIIGSVLDRKLGSYPRLTLGLLGAGVILSFVTFYQTIQTVLRNTNDTSKGKRA